MRVHEDRDVVVVEAVRTPIGRGRAGGIFADVHANDLLGAVYEAVIERSGVEAAHVEAVLAGCVDKVGEQATNIARNAWLQAGLPVETSCATLDFQCGSSQHAAGLAAAQIATGMHDVMIAAGIEHMGHVPILADQVPEYGTPFPPAIYERHALVHQGISAEKIAEHWEIPRRELDELGVRSHRLAAQATEEGRFADEIVPIRVGDVTHATDEGIRPGSSIETLAALKPAFIEEGRVTAGNSSQISDGAAAVLLTTAAKAKELGLTPRARIVDHTTVGVDPVMNLTGPIPATRKILERNAIGMDDVDRVEINEAFASVVAAWRLELEPDFDRVNVNGGAIALGHPLGASGARLMTTLVHELERSGGELGLITMCCGGGLGAGTLLQRV